MAEFFFDQSTAHAAFADDALNANEMNVQPGGKQRAMHPTNIPDNNSHVHLRGTVQTMMFDENLPPEHPDFEFRGKPKGMCRILEERGFWDEFARLNGGKGIPGDCSNCKMSHKEKEKRAREAAEIMGGQDEAEASDEENFEIPVITGAKCCMRKVLSEQADNMPLIFMTKNCCFRLSLSVLAISVISSRNSIVRSILLKCTGAGSKIVSPFACKHYPSDCFKGFRCLGDGTFPTAKKLIPELLDACEIKTIRAFYQKTWRYMDAYEKVLFGLTSF